MYIYILRSAIRQKQKVTWKSSNTKVAKVSSKGVVTTLGVGKAKITAVAKDGSRKKASVTIKVNKPSKTSIRKIEGLKKAVKQAVNNFIYEEKSYIQKEILF